MNPISNNTTFLTSSTSASASADSKNRKLEQNYFSGNTAATVSTTIIQNPTAAFETPAAAKTASVALSTIEVDTKTKSSMAGTAAATSTLGEQLSSIIHSLIHHDPSCYLLVKYLEKAPKEFNLSPAQLYALIFKDNPLLVERLLDLKDDFTKLPRAILDIFSLPEIGGSIQDLNLKNKRIHSFEQFSKMFPNVRMLAFAGPYTAALTHLKNLKELHVKQLENASGLPALPHLKVLSIDQQRGSFTEDLGTLLDAIPEKFPGIDSLTLHGDLSKRVPLKSIKPLSNIRHLDITFCKLPSMEVLTTRFPNAEGITFKYSADITDLPHWPSLRTLNVKVSHHNMLDLENPLSKNPQIQHLSLSSNGRSFDELNTVLKPLKQLSSLCIDLLTVDTAVLNPWIGSLNTSHPTLSKLELPVAGLRNFQGLAVSGKPKVHVQLPFDFEVLALPLPNIPNVDFTIEKGESHRLHIRMENKADNHFKLCYGKAPNPLVDIFDNNHQLASELIFSLGAEPESDRHQFIWEALTRVGPNIRTFGSDMEALNCASTIAPVIPNIETLHIKMYQNIDIAKLWPRLREIHLSLSFTHTPPPDMASWSSLTHLHTVHLWSPAANELETLAKAKPGLKSLILEACQMGQARMGAVKKFTALEELILNDSHFSADGYKPLGTMSTLKKLALPHLQDFSHIFAGLSNLVSLTAGGLPANSLAVVGSQLPNLTEFDCCSNTGKGREFVEELAHFKKLTKLTIALNASADLSSLVKACPNLEELVIYNRFDADDAMQLCNLKKLKRLKCRDIYSFSGEERRAAVMKTLESQGCKVEFMD